MCLCVTEDKTTIINTRNFKVYHHTTMAWLNRLRKVQVRYKSIISHKIKDKILFSPKKQRNNMRIMSNSSTRETLKENRSMYFFNLINYYLILIHFNVQFFFPKYQINYIVNKFVVF